MNSHHRIMRWNCDSDGCFNIKHRLKLGIFDDIWPGKIGMGDIDGIVEISGNALMLEWKQDTIKIPTGQQIMFKRITNGKKITVFCVTGNAETMAVTSYKIFFNGREFPKNTWTPIDMDKLKAKLKSWCEWAQKNPRIAA